MQNGTFDTDVTLGCKTGESWSIKVSGEWKWDKLLGSQEEYSSHLLYSITQEASDIKGTLDGIGSIPRQQFSELYKSHIFHNATRWDYKSCFRYPNLINIRTLLTVYLPKGGINYSYEVLTHWEEAPYGTSPMFRGETCRIFVKDFKEPDGSFEALKGYDHSFYLESKFTHWFAEHWLWVRRLFG